MNYNLITGARQLGIQWGKVEIIAWLKERKKIKKLLPPLLQKVKISTSGTILGKRLGVALAGRKAVKIRIKKAKNTLQQRKEKTMQPTQNQNAS